MNKPGNGASNLQIVMEKDITDAFDDKIKGFVNVSQQMQASFQKHAPGTAQAPRG